MKKPAAVAAAAADDPPSIRIELQEERIERGCVRLYNAMLTLRLEGLTADEALVALSTTHLRAVASHDRSPDVVYELITKHANEMSKVIDDLVLSTMSRPTMTA